ncbi:MAG: glutathione S-transferase family protein [Candidatus Cloacimonetes bacterium]|nr:glutathione S-transferase family protein [Candidatus Cloacimonadota bacterium]
MLELYQFPRAKAFPNYSPFCLKVELYLVFHGIEYRVNEISSLKSSPTGKVPYIVHDSKIITDSNRILPYLDEHFRINMDFTLDERQKGISRMVDSLCQDSLYFVMVYSRWMEPDNFQKISDGLLVKLPHFLRGIPRWYIQRQISNQLWAQGVLRNTRDQIYALGRRDLEAISRLLGKQHYIHGMNMTMVDMTVFAFLANIHYPPFDSPLKTEFLRFQNLLDYCERVKARIQMSF